MLKNCLIAFEGTAGTYWLQNYFVLLLLTPYRQHKTNQTDKSSFLLAKEKAPKSHIINIRDVMLEILYMIRDNSALKHTAGQVFYYCSECVKKYFQHSFVFTRRMQILYYQNH